MNRPPFQALVLSVFLFVLGLPVSGAAGQDRPPLGAETQAQAALNAVLAKFGHPGGVLSVAGPGGQEVAAAGYADIAAQRPVTPDTRFHIASTGKMITATAVLRSIEEGHYGLSSPVLPLLDAPEARRLGAIEGVTVADLLTHRSGLADCLRNSTLFTEAHSDRHWTALDVIRYAPCQGGGQGGVFDYCNTNFILLGRILETQSSAGFAEVLTDLVLHPAGMMSTTIGADPGDASLAHGYRRPDGQGRRRDASVLAWSSPLGDAPVTTTARDMDRFLAALLGPGANLLEPATVDAMTTDRMMPDENDPGEGYGLGIEVETTAWGLKLGHSGRLAGFSAEVWYFPERKTRIVLLLNGDSPPDTDLLEPVLSRIFGSAPTDLQPGR